MKRIFSQKTSLLLALFSLVTVCNMAHAGQSIDLSLTYTDGVTNFTPGGSLLYTAEVTNNSAVDIATNFTATASVPSIATFNNANNGGTFANGTVSWVVPALAPGATLFLQFTIDVPLTVPSGTSKTMSSTATVTINAAQTDPNAGNNSATDNNVLNIAPDLTICTIAHAQECIYTNGLLTYVITICDIGNVDVNGVVVTDTIPPETTFVSADNGGTFANGVVTFPAQPLEARKQYIFTVVVRVKSPLPAGLTTIINTVTLSDDGSNGPDADPSNNTSSVSDCVKPSVDLQIVKTVDITNPNLGDNVVYVLTVTNNGPDDATNAVVNDKLPAGLTLVSATQSAGLFDTVSGVWTIGQLPAGQSARLTLTCTVATTPTGPIVNQACVTNTVEEDTVQSNNCSSVTITPSCALRPQIISGATLSRPIAVAGTPQTFTISVDNGGNLPVTIHWDFGDGTTGTGATVQHTYQAGGSYSVVVTVSNACGGVATTASLNQGVQSQPAAFECTLLRAPLNLTRNNSDSLTLLAQLNLPPATTFGGKKVTVQINDMYYAVQLNKSGKFKDAHTTASLKSIDGNAFLTFKLTRSALRSRLVPGISTQTRSFTMKDTPLLIGVGTDFYGTKMDLQYTSKRNAGILTQ